MMMSTPLDDYIPAYLHRSPDFDIHLAIFRVQVLCTENLKGIRIKSLNDRKQRSASRGLAQMV